MTNNYSKDLEDMVLGTLSFYEKMDESLIIMDMDSNFLERHPELDKETLSLILSDLVKRKLVKKVKYKGDTFYQRIFKKPSLIKRIRRFLGM